MMLETDPQPNKQTQNLFSFFLEKSLNQRTQAAECGSRDVL